MPDPEARALLDYWYAPAMRRRWFDSTPALDAEIRERFEDLFRRAASGELDAWLDDPDEALALVIILDQLPLNMYRGRPEAFASEAIAIAAAKRAIELGHDLDIAKERLQFLYMPLMHSEALADQDMSVAMFARAGLDENLRYAEHHRDIVRRFGRFPHRNAILGRESRPEELDYLAAPGAFKG
jgi:uncharacterized protein (DUF924 family)